MHTAASKDLITQWLNLKWDYKFYQIGKKKKSLHGNSQENQNSSPMHLCQQHFTL